jgi:hypothetical protein
MNSNTEGLYLKLCLEKIEIRLKRGPSSRWTSYDFEQLSNEIQVRTGVLLSVTTLKRIWGRVKYTSLPATTTLNALARFTGSNDWNAFKHDTIQHAPPKPTSAEQTNQRNPSNYSYWFIGILLLAIMASAIFYYSKPHKDIDPTSYKFSSNKVLSVGLPNSVVFNYSVPKSGNDSVFIAQSWDETRKVAVSRNEHVFSSIYYEPGHYTAKLIIGDNVVKEHDILIASAGWMALAERDSGTPIYFEQKQILKGKTIGVDNYLLTKYNLNKHPSPPLVRIFNIQDIKGIKSDNYTFETSIKGSSDHRGEPCQRVDVSLVGKDDIISVALCTKGCVGDLSLYAWGHIIDSKTADLSGFGCDLGTWVNLRLVAKNGITQIFINDRLAHSIKYSNHPVAIIGVRYSFNGSGSVQHTRLIKGNKVINF